MAPFSSFCQWFIKTIDISNNYGIFKPQGDNVMKNKLFNEFMNNARSHGMFEDNVKKLVVSYYLSRRLTSNNIDDIISTFEDEYIKQELLVAYNEQQESIDELSKINNITQSEMVNLLNQISEMRTKNNVDMITPKSIIDLSLLILNLNKEDIVLDIGSGYGTTLLNSSHITNHVAGIEINRDAHLISQLLLDLYGLPYGNVIKEDALVNDNEIFKANKVFMHTPIGLRISNKWLESIIESKFLKSKYKNLVRANDVSWLFALDVIENTKYEKFVMIVAGNTLFNTRDSEIRKNLIIDGKIESVISLASNLLNGTAIPIYLIVFSNGNKNIKMVNGQELYSEKGFSRYLDAKHIQMIIKSLDEDSEISRTVSIEELSKEDYSLVPHVYETSEFPFDNSVRLGDVVNSISRGSMITKDDLEKLTTDETTDYQYLMLQNFQEGIIDGQLPYLKKIDKSQEKFLIKEKSLIVSKMSPFKIGTIDKLKTNILANGNLYCLEVDESKIDRDFLAAYLQSREGINELERYAKGSVMKTISISDLKKVRIPIITREEQNAVGKEYALLNSELKALKQRHVDILKEKSNIIKERNNVPRY